MNLKNFDLEDNFIDFQQTNHYYKLAKYSLNNPNIWGTVLNKKIFLNNIKF